MIKSILGKNVISQLLKYGLVGIANTFLSFFLYWLFCFVMDYTLANATSFFLCTINGYIWNKLWTFRTSGFDLGELLRYFLIYSCSFAFSQGLLIALVEILCVDKMFAWFFASALAVLVSFVGQKFFAFRTK